MSEPEILRKKHGLLFFWVIYLIFYAPFTLQVVVLQLEVFFLEAEPPPGSPHFIRVVHITGRQPLIRHGFFNRQ